MGAMLSLFDSSGGAGEEVNTARQEMWHPTAEWCYKVAIVLTRRLQREKGIVALHSEENQPRILVTVGEAM